MNKFTPQGKVKVVQSSVLNPENAGLRLIVNLCSKDGKFENKLDKLLTSKWNRVREEYKGWYASQHNFKTGELMHMAVSSEIWVVSLLVREADGKIDDKTAAKAVSKLAALAKYENASVHCSNILVEEYPQLKDLLVSSVAQNGTHTYFYDEPVKNKTV
jgi:hypothetical protein